MNPAILAFMRIGAISFSAKSAAHFDTFTGMLVTVISQAFPHDFLQSSTVIADMDMENPPPIFIDTGGVPGYSPPPAWAQKRIDRLPERVRLRISVEETGIRGYPKFHIGTNFHIVILTDSRGFVKKNIRFFSGGRADRGKLKDFFRPPPILNGEEHIRSR